MFAGGEPVAAEIAARLPMSAYVIAADSGLYQARRLGRAVDLAVGDFDSIDDADVRALETHTAVERHPTAKDKTDIALGLDAAAVRGVRRVDVVAGAGGRLDHALANLLVLASADYGHMDVRAWIGDARVQVVRGRCEVHGRPGATVSLLALGGPATGITTEGLEYGLSDGRLEAGSTRGVSNVLAAGRAVVTVTDGVVLAVQPAALATTGATP